MPYQSLPFKERVTGNSLVKKGGNCIKADLADMKNCLGLNIVIIKAFYLRLSLLNFVSISGYQLT